MSFERIYGCGGATQEQYMAVTGAEPEGNKTLDEDVAAIDLAGGDGRDNLASELTEAVYDEIDPDGELRRNGKLEKIPLNTLVELSTHIVGGGDFQTQVSSTLPSTRQQVRAEICPEIQKHEFGPFERLVQTKQYYSLEILIKREQAIIRAKDSGCQSDAQIADFLRVDDSYNKDIAEARKNYGALINDYRYLNLGEWVSRKNLTPAQVAKKSSNEGIKCAVTTSNRKLLEEIVKQAGRIYSFRNDKAQIAAGLATYGHYEGQTLENYPIRGLYLPKKDHAIRIASAMVASMHDEDGMLIDAEVEYDRLSWAGINAMKYYLDGKTEWHSLLATYHPNEARIIIDHILIKLMEKEVIAARMVTSEEDGGAVNTVHISLTPKYLPENQKFKDSPRLLPEPFTGSFLPTQGNFYK